MSNWRTEYWRVYNVMVRVLGASALVAGTGFVGWGARRMMRMGLERSMGNRA